MIDGVRLVISVAASELALHELRGSILTLDDLVRSRLSKELTTGLQMLEAACARAGTEITVIVRPEIFTHGASLQWLRDHVGACCHHLCFSDGEAVRVLPGFDNHVFFYRPGAERCSLAFLKLRRRAPELLGVLKSQVNSAYVFNEKKPRSRPRTTLLTRLQPDGAACQLLPFFMSSGRVERDVQAILAHDRINLDTIAVASGLTYVALTETAFENPAFMAGLVSQLLLAYVRPAEYLILQIPLVDRPALEVEHCIEFLQTGLRRCAPSLPSGRPQNVFLHVGGDIGLPEQLFAGASRLIVHESFSFWQFAAEFYRRFETLHLLRDDRSAQHGTALREVMAGATDRVWFQTVLPQTKGSSLGRFCW